MATYGWGKTKSGQAYPKRKKSGTKRKGSIKATGKKMPVCGKCLDLLQEKVDTEKMMAEHIKDPYFKKFHDGTYSKEPKK